MSDGADNFYKSDLLTVQKVVFWRNSDACPRPRRKCRRRPAPAGRGAGTRPGTGAVLTQASQ
jgi:hypothetical protein